MQDLIASRIAADNAAKLVTSRLHEEIPELCAIDSELSSLGMQIISREKPIDEIKERNLFLQEERKKLLKSKGYKEDEDKPSYQCAVCSDSGYDDEMLLCMCVRKRLAEERYLSSGLGKAHFDKTFDTFSLDYYAGADMVHMKSLKDTVQRYAEQFPVSDGCGILMMGGTGLGKTHLAAAVAHTVIGKGFGVMYESAQQMADKSEAVRFGREERASVDRYRTVPLLIIDDLGAECTTPHTSAFFSSLIDYRIANGLATIISTNLTSSQLKKIYSDRVYSRLIGEYKTVTFKGNDVRMQKLSAK